MTTDMVELQPMKNDFDDDEEDYRDQDIEDIMTAAPPEDISDEEVIENTGKPLRFKKIHENTSAGRLQARVPDVPDNLIDLVFRKKCHECNNILGTISSALAHYNCSKHQTKLAFLFLPHGIYNLPLSKEEIREIETGVNKGAEAETKPLAPRKMPFRDLVKKFEINEDVRKLDMEFCRLCELPFSSKVAALQHYSGKKHKKNAENWSPYNPPKAIDTKDELRCDVCNVIVDSSIPMETHLSGKRHAMKLKAYLERVNAGAIAPPMSSRGFCDFNNVEREEANPLDPSKFIQEITLPKNLMGSFVNREEVPESIQYEGVPGTYGDIPLGGGYDAQYMYEADYKPNFAGGMATEYGNGGYPGETRGMGGGYPGETRGMGGGYPGETRGMGGGYPGETRGMGGGYPGETRGMGGGYPGGIGIDGEIRGGGVYEDPYGGGGYMSAPVHDYDIAENAAHAFKEGRMPPPPWAPVSQIPSRNQLHSPYAPNFPARAGNKVPVQSFGPTKFKYNRQQPF